MEFGRYFKGNACQLSREVKKKSVGHIIVLE